MMSSLKKIINVEDQLMYNKFNPYSNTVTVSEWIKEFRDPLNLEEEYDIEYDDYSIDFTIEYDYE